MNAAPTVSDVCTEFIGVVDALYGAFLDAGSGCEKNAAILDDMQRDMLPQLQADDPTFTQKHLDDADYIYGGGTVASVLHRVTQAEYRRRNEARGSNHTFLGNMYVVSVYSYWEDHYRQAIADAAGVAKNRVGSDPIGDVRHFRTSIVHHRGIALEEVETCKVFRWFKTGDAIAFTFRQVMDITLAVTADLRRIDRDLTLPSQP